MKVRECHFCKRNVCTMTVVDARRGKEILEICKACWEDGDRQEHWKRENEERGL